jgi:transposase InsO family protein
MVIGPLWVWTTVVVQSASGIKIHGVSSTGKESRLFGQIECYQSRVWPMGRDATSKVVFRPLPSVLRADVFDYIERLYNPKRRHSTIGYISPAQFKNLQCA